MALMEWLLSYYTAFTSPIRRYLGCLCNRLLQHYVDGGEIP